MTDEEKDVVEQMRHDAAEWLRGHHLAADERPTIHHRELPEGPPDSPIAAEWSFYRRQVGQLLAEGHEGKWVLIKGERLVGLWHTEEEAYQVAREKYLMQPVLIHQVLTREPVLRGPSFLRLCRG